MSTGLIFDRRFGAATILRSSSYAKWRADRGSTEWTQAFLLARAEELLVAERYGRMVRSRDLARAWGTQLLATGAREDHVDYYEASLFYKRPLRQRWLYGYVEPLVRWDRKYDWHPDPGIRIGIDVLFWDLAGRRARIPPVPVRPLAPEDRPVPMPADDSPPRAFTRPAGRP